MDDFRKDAALKGPDPAPQNGQPDGARARPRSRDDDIDAYLVELGQRVRSMRAVRGMSRKVLAQESGVSERYIAQLESGLGNVSIMLLRRVADATGAPLEDLVAEPARQPPDWQLIRELLRKAPAETISDVKALLSGQPAEHARGAAPRIEVDRVALIGLRGAGKSTLGRLAAEKLGWRFVELNKEIEKEAGFSVTEVFSIYGHDGYRRYEQAALERIIAEPGAVIVATGGGIVSDPVTFERLLGSFFTVWIKASPGEHMGRVRKQGDLRPMGADKAAMSELITILRSREPLYARARVAIDTSGATIDQSLLTLLRTIQSYCVSGCPWQSRNR
ncbi:MAG: helix-turn-helix transcriptional regulator [Hyphomicrobiales bacterium]|nr:helix-turn-helix transcriptional regulator [Hyphomicrobiales bacterium]